MSDNITANPIAIDMPTSKPALKGASHTEQQSAHNGGFREWLLWADF